ncbi:DUF72 domain-containing protein [Persephonella sp.]
MKSYIGCSGFFYWHWKGRFYPPDLKPSKWFEYYVKFFNTVEINSTFYNFPKEKNLKNWMRKSPESFLFSVKVHRSITHNKRFKDVKDDLERFYKIVSEVLTDKLGVFLFQLPPSFRYSEYNLKILIESLNLSYKNVVEFRHKSWWNNDVFKVFSKKGITFCSVNAPKLPGEIIKTTDTVYLRFHGRDRWYKYYYTDDELKTYAENIIKIKPRFLYTYFNNDYEGNAPINAKNFKELIDKLLEKDKSTNN